MSKYDPKYDEDNVSFGYLKKVLGENIKNITSDNSNVNYSKNFAITPLPPYHKGDTWNKNGNVYVCVSERLMGKFNIDDWKLLYDKEINETLSNNFQFLSSVEISTIDEKIETFYQKDEPSINWKDIEKQNHIGDYYQNSSNYKTYIYNKNFSWEEINVTSLIFDNITGHRNIFVKQPSSYNEGDIWKVINTNDAELLNVSLNDFVQANTSNNIFNKDNWVKITNELNIKANLYSPAGKMIAANNVFSNLQYSSFGKHDGYSVLGFDTYITGTGSVNNYADISIDIDLPDNFKVVSAFLSLYHTPVYWSYFNITSQMYINTWGASKNLKIFKMKSERNIKLLYENSVTYRYEINQSDLEEIPNAFGSASYTPANINDTSITRKDSINIKNYLNKTGKTKLVIRTSGSVPTDGAVVAKSTGMGKAIVNILGYVDLKGSD